MHYVTWQYIIPAADFHKNTLKKEQLKAPANQNSSNMELFERAS